MEEGHVCIPRDRLKQRVNRLVNSEIDCELLIDTLISEKRLVENNASVFFELCVPSRATNRNTLRKQIALTTHTKRFMRYQIRSQVSRETLLNLS